MSTAAKPPAEHDLVAAIRDHLEAILKIMDEAAEQGLTINFGINNDVATKKSTLTSLTVTRSHL